MKKIIISRLFLYKYRFIIGYILLSLALVGTIFFLPLITPGGISEPEMESVITSNNTNLDSILNGDIIDLPYHALQHLSIHFFGLNAYAIKLPSIIIGAILAFLLILLLNRWFKNNVALIASIITVLSTPFLYLAGSGTPLIMLVFWPTLLLWLGSKIQGVKKPNSIYCFIFAFLLLFSLLTPHLIYLAAFIFIFVLLQPHLRHTLKTLPRIPFVIIALIILAGLGAIGYSLSHNPSAITTLLLTEDFSIDKFFANLAAAVPPLFSSTGNVESTFLSPLIGLPILALAFTGLISTAKGFFASRNSIASCLIVFTALLAGLDPRSAILIILPLAILIAHGTRYILERWYGIFPENPYARIFALVPLSILLGVMIFSDVSHFIFGYRYNPIVASQFNNDLALIDEFVEENTTLLVPKNTTEYDFYKILEDAKHITISNSAPTSGKIASLGKWEKSADLQITRIITSPKSEESDRIYLYTVKSKE